MMMQSNLLQLLSVSGVCSVLLTALRVGQDYVVIPTDKLAKVALENVAKWLIK